MLILLSASVSSQALAQDHILPRIEGSFRAGSDRNIYQTEVWMPLAQGRDRVTYGSVRISGDFQSNDEQNLGIGHRRMTGDVIVGGAAWMDRRTSKAGNVFYQTTFGAEVFSDKIDIRANAYLPITKEHKMGSGGGVASGPFFAGTGIFTSTPGSLVEEAQKGFDMEVGTALPFFQDKIDSARVYAGGYHFVGDKTDNVSGWRARATVDITPWVAVGARFQKDAERGSQSFLEATFRFPGKTSYRKEGLRARLDESPERDIDIVTAAKEEPPKLVPLTNAQTGAAQRIIHVDNTKSGGDGSVESPYSTLAAAQTALQSYDVLYVHQGNGSSSGMDAGINLNKQGLQMIGSGMNLYYDLANLTATINPTSTSVLVARATAAPVIRNAAGDGITIQANDITVAGLIVDGSSRDGIVIDANATTANNVFITNVTARNNRMGIYAHGYNGGAVSARIQNSLTTANSQHGIAVYDDTAGAFNVDLGGGTLNSAGRNGLYGNTMEDLSVDLDGGVLSAQNNWWGQATGPDQDAPNVGVRPQIYYGAPINDGLMAHWTFDSEWTTNTTAYDRSSRNHNGTLTNGMTIANLVAGDQRNALTFDGVDDAVRITDHPDLYITGDSTILSVIRPSSSGENFVGRIIDRSNNTGGGNGYILHVNANNIGSRNNNGATEFGPGGMGMNNWHDVGLTNNLVSKGFYLDGATNNVVQGAMPTNNPVADVSIGNRTGATDRTFDGLIDDVRIYNRVLTAAEMAEVFRMNTSSTVNATGFLSAAP